MPPDSQFIYPASSVLRARNLGILSCKGLLLGQSLLFSVHHQAGIHALVSPFLIKYTAPPHREPLLIMARSITAQSSTSSELVGRLADGQVGRQVERERDGLSSRRGLPFRRTRPSFRRCFRRCCTRACWWRARRRRARARRSCPRRRCPCPCCRSCRRSS